MKVLMGIITTLLCLVMIGLLAVISISYFQEIPIVDAISTIGAVIVIILDIIVVIGSPLFAAWCVKDY